MQIAGAFGYLPHWMCGEPRTIGPLNDLICLRIPAEVILPALAGLQPDFVVISHADVPKKWIGSIHVLSQAATKHTVR